MGEEKKELKKELVDANTLTAAEIAKEDLDITAFAKENPHPDRRLRRLTQEAKEAAAAALRKKTAENEREAILLAKSEALTARVKKQNKITSKELEAEDKSRRGDRRRLRRL